MIFELIYVLLALCMYFLYMYKKNHKYFSSKNVKFLPGYPVFGNTDMTKVLRRELTHQELNYVYKAFPEEKYVGFSDGVTPMIIIRDAQVFSEVLVEAQDHFDTRRAFGGDTFMEHNLVSMSGNNWRKMRHALSPAYTLSKLRQMFPFVNECCGNLVVYLKENQNTPVFVHTILSKYLSDNYCNSALGMKINSYDDPQNDFYQMCKKLELFSIWQKFKFGVTFLFPVFAKYTPIFPTYVIEFYRDTIWKKYSEYRQDNKIERADLLQLLMKTNSKIDWTPEQIAAQLFIFNMGTVFSTVSGILMTIHELALNPDVQEKLFEEVSAHHQKNKDKELTLDMLSGLNYLDCVWKETLRKFPPFFMIDRICTKPYTLPPSRVGAEPLHINPGDKILGLVYSIQNDEKYFDDPEKFDPERFYPENKDKIKPHTYIPFGNGIRKCIGNGYGTMLQKALIYHLVLNFNIMKHEKTKAFCSGWPIDSPSLVQFKSRS